MHESPQVSSVRFCPSVKWTIRESPGSKIASAPGTPRVNIVNEEVWVSKSELDYLHRLKSWHPATLPQLPLSVVNLACAILLPGTDGMPVGELCKRLDSWAERVREVTEGSRIEFLSYPEQFEFSEPFWRMLMLTSVLQQEYGIHYETSQMRVMDWSDTRYLFIHGLLGPERSGTCPSIPVLVAAIAQRLGYPVWLCHAPAHVFCRWADPQTGITMNIEFHGVGMVVRPDHYYHHWPVEWEPELYEQEKVLGQRRHFLRPLDPHEVLAAFLVTRGHVWQAHGRWSEATATYNTACELAPYNRAYAFYASESWRKMVDPDYELADVTGNHMVTA